MSSQGVTSNSPTSTYSGNSQSSTPLSPPPHGGASSGVRPVSSLGESSTTSDVTMESLDTSHKKQDASDRLDKNLDWNSGKPESSKNIIAVQDGQQGHDGQESASTPLIEGESPYCSYKVASIILNTQCINKNVVYHFFILVCTFETNIVINSVIQDGAENLEKSEVQAIIESTPELDMDLNGCIGTRYKIND